MTKTKEAVYAALATRLSAVAGIRTTGRKVRHFDDVAPPEQPALFIEQTAVEYEGATRHPSKLKIKANVLVYAWEESATGPMPAINTLVDAVESLLGRQSGEESPSYTTTLGGLVASARVTGIEYAGGNLGNQGVAVISVEMLTA